jgi:hypothetical protein
LSFYYLISRSGWLVDWIVGKLICQQTTNNM